MEMVRQMEELIHQRKSNSPPNNLFQSALEYSEKYHFSVIPIKPDKKPYIQWTPYQKKKATTAEIRQWWTKWPQAMIGIVTGEVSGIFVLDCDTQAGFEQYKAPAGQPCLSAGANSARGWHLYFKWLEDYKMTIASGVMPG